MGTAPKVGAYIFRRTRVQYSTRKNHRKYGRNKRGIEPIHILRRRMGMVEGRVEQDDVEMERKFTTRYMYTNRRLIYLKHKCDKRSELKSEAI